MHKLTTELAGSFPNAEHRFERLEKRGMFNGSRAHNRRLAKADWSTICWMLSYKAGVGEPLNPRNSTRSCSRCGGTNKAPKGAVCGLRIDRQLNAAINLYLQMEGLSPTPKLFDELMRGWSGFTLTGEEADEGSNEPWRSPRLLNSKSYVSQSKTT
jgi:transposase